VLNITWIKWLAFLGILILMLAAPGTGKALKIGYINSEEIFENFKGKKKAQEKYDKEVAAWQQKMEKKQKEIQELKEKAKARELLMSKEAKEKLKNEIDRKSQEYQHFVTEVFGREGKAFRKNAEYTKPIVERIMAIIKRIAEEEDYDFVFDTVNGGLIHSKPDYNLTKRVLAILNKESGKK
jgi:outer membrane protein